MISRPDQLDQLNQANRGEPDELVKWIGDIAVNIIKTLSALTLCAESGFFGNTRRG